MFQKYPSTSDLLLVPDKSLLFSGSYSMSAQRHQAAHLLYHRAVRIRQVSTEDAFKVHFGTIITTHGIKENTYNVQLPTNMKSNDCMSKEIPLGNEG